VRQTVKGPARDNVPYQWVIRRINSGFFNDSDAVMYDAATSSGLKLAELSPTVQQVLGGSHNMLIVAMKDHLVVVDAPISEEQSLWAILAAKQRYPGKPIRYLVMTHHHLDHSWGVRAFMAEGATIVVGSPGKSFFEAVAKADLRAHPDRLQKNPRKANIIEVADRHVLADGSEEVTAYRMDNPHADGMLLVHVKSNNLAYNTDLYAPGRDTGRTPQNVSVQTALTKFGLRPAVMAGGHGSNGSYEDFLKLVSQ
jgi:glyoxylase-like metal-dependent hydrolase (beta-lactamase superfamily II)